MKDNGIVIYTTGWCGYCHAAKRLLRSKGVDFEDVDLDERPELRAEVARRAGRMTVPQTFVNGVPLGGYDELAALERAGELDSKLGVSTNENEGG